jgi:hypothetical protein
MSVLLQRKLKTSEEVLQLKGYWLLKTLILTQGHRDQINVMSILNEGRGARARRAAFLTSTIVNPPHKPAAVLVPRANN